MLRKFKGTNTSNLLSSIFNKLFFEFELDGYSLISMLRGFFQHTIFFINIAAIKHFAFLWDAFCKCFIFVKREKMFCFLFRLGEGTEKRGRR